MDAKEKAVRDAAGALKPAFSASSIAFSVKAATDLFMRPELGGYFIQITEYLNGERAFTRPSGTT